jgi:hypothetical protein
MVVTGCEMPTMGYNLMALQKLANFGVAAIVSLLRGT